MIRAVNTGVINLSLAVQESAEKISREERAKRAKKNVPVVEDNNDVSKSTIIFEENSKKI